MAFRNR